MTKGALGFSATGNREKPLFILYKIFSLQNYQSVVPFLNIKKLNFSILLRSIL